MPSTTVVMPSRLLDISWMISGIRVVNVTIGAASPACMTFSTRARRRPSLPAGCSDANSSSPKPLRTRSVIASASPMARAAVVLAVGTRFIGQASLATEQSRMTSAARASVDAGLPVSAISRAPMRRIDSSSRSSSSVSPLCESASTTSSSRIAPRSPCVASAGWRNQAEVPVLDSVAEIFRQMMPDLPMPVTMTRPLHSNSSVTARSKLASMRSTRPRIAPASMRSTLRASSSPVSVCGAHHLVPSGAAGATAASAAIA